MASVDLQEKANFSRLSRLLVDKGTEALRNTFDGLHPPAHLPAVLNANKSSLLKLKPRVINVPQWDLLYPPSGNPPDSKTFDVTLLTVLLRNICGFPKTGWSIMPVDTDRSTQANIVRIKSYRNEVYAHVTSTEVDAAAFELLWQKITQTLVELKIPQSDVDDLKICPLAPEEEIYIGILKDWELREKECIAQEQESLKLLQCLNSDVKSIGYSLNRLTQITKENRYEIRQLYQSATQEEDKEIKRSITQSSPIPRDANMSDEDLLRKLAKHNFKSKIRVKVNLFHPSTREWLLNDVHNWFYKNRYKSNILLLTAGPGFGKSVFAAKVCKDFEKKKKLAACHFCDFSDSNLRNPMMMVQSLASQMCENVCGFKEKLIDQLKRPHEVRSLKDAFGIYLQNPLNELEKTEKKRRLVVIDGLDECAADEKNDIVNFIADCFPDLSDHIKIFLTSRPEISVARLKSIPSIHIGNIDSNNDVDLERYFRACFPSVSSWSEHIFETLVEMCEGSFLYAYYVQRELQKRTDLNNITLDEIIQFLPKGLHFIYQAYFQRLEDELDAIIHGCFDVLRILEMLAASQAPLPITFLTEALGLAPSCRETRKIINKINGTVSCLLYISDDLVTVFHKSVIDWLLARGYQHHNYTVTVCDGNQSLWLRCEQVLEEIKTNACAGQELKFTNARKYALSHGFKHLTACNMIESFFWLVDVVIIHVLLTMFPQSCGHYTLVASTLYPIWLEVLHNAVEISDELRARISWHITEIDSMPNYVPGRRVPLLSDPHFYYLQSVYTHSPEGCFSEHDKKFAELLLSDVPRFIELNFYEVEFMPLAVRPLSSSSEVRAVGVSFDRKIAAVAQENGRIIMVCLPNLVELWRYSTGYGNIQCCAFNPDDSFVLFGKLKTALNITERKEVPFFHNNEETFIACAFSEKGMRLLTCDDLNAIKLWDVEKQDLLSSFLLNVPVSGCIFTNAGLLIISKSEYEERDSMSEDVGNISSARARAIEHYETDADTSYVDSWHSASANGSNVSLTDARFSLHPTTPPLRKSKFTTARPHIPSKSEYEERDSNSEDVGKISSAQARAIEHYETDADTSYVDSWHSASTNGSNASLTDARFSLPLKTVPLCKCEFTTARLDITSKSEYKERDSKSEDVGKISSAQACAIEHYETDADTSYVNTYHSALNDYNIVSDVFKPGMKTSCKLDDSEYCIFKDLSESDEDEFDAPTYSRDSDSTQEYSPRDFLLTLVPFDIRYFEYDVELPILWKAIRRLCKCFFRSNSPETLKPSLEIRSFTTFKSSEIPCKACFTGIYNGVPCIFAWSEQSLIVIESSDFTVLAAWNLFIPAHHNLVHPESCKQVSTLDDDMWLYADVEKLIIFKTKLPRLPQTQDPSSGPPMPTRVLWSSFSSDSSRLAICTSNGYINIWNVNARQIEQSFKSDENESPFACWWSKEFLFVLFNVRDRIFSLSKYPMDVNTNVLFSKGQQVSCNLVNEFSFSSEIVDFSEGLLICQLEETNSVKLVNVNRVGKPEIVILPGIKPNTSVTVSPGASFVFGSYMDAYCIWKRCSQNPCAYEVFSSELSHIFSCDFVCCFSIDSKLAFVFDKKTPSWVEPRIIDLDNGDKRNISLDRWNMNSKLFFLDNEKILIAVSHHFIQFFDIESGALLDSSFQYYLTRDSVMQSKLSPNGTTLVYPKVNGDMEFTRLCIPDIFCCH